MSLGFLKKNSLVMLSVEAHKVSRVGVCEGGEHVFERRADASLDDPWIGLSKAFPGKGMVDALDDCIRGINERAVEVEDDRSDFLHSSG